MKHKFFTILSITIVLFFLYPCSDLYGIETEAFRSGVATVFFEKPLELPAREVMRMYPEVKAELEDMLGIKLDFKVNILLIKNRNTFEKMLGSDLFVAIADPQRKLIIIDYSRMNVRPFTLKTTLKHEACHLLLHRHIDNGNLPRWLNEGIAQWVSDGMAEIIMKRDRSILNRAVLTGNYIHLRNLQNYFPNDRQALLLAYEQSKSITEFIIAEYGKDAMLNILGSLIDGDDIYTSCRKNLSISLYDLESNWDNHLRKRISWLSLLSNYLYEILFFIAALLSILGFIKHLRKRREIHQSLERDDDDDYFIGMH